MSEQQKEAGQPWHRWLLLGFIAMAFGLVYWFFGDSLTFENLAEHQESLKAYEAQHPWLFFTAAFALYVLVSGLSIPGGAVLLTLVYGSYFGWLKSVALVSFGSTGGATTAFLTSRYLFRDAVQRKFAEQLVGISQRLEEEGAFYLFTLRLIVAVPFFMVNLVMGLTKMRWTTFWWVSQLGMLPGTMAYAYAGSTLQLSELAEHGFDGVGWPTLLAFAILGLLPIAIKKLMGYVRENDDKTAATI